MYATALNDLAGRSDVYKGVVRKYFPHLATLAADVVQEALLVAHKNVASFRGEADFQKWFIGILWNTMKMFSRKQSRFDRMMPLDDCVSVESRVLQRLIHQEEAERASLVFRDLPPEKRRAIVDRTDKTTAARSRRHRARLLLRRSMLAAHS